jgi:hypothetical protein
LGQADTFQIFYAISFEIETPYSLPAVRRKPHFGFLIEHDNHTKALLPISIFVIGSVSGVSRATDSRWLSAAYQSIKDKYIAAQLPLLFLVDVMQLGSPDTVTEESMERVFEQVCWLAPNVGNVRLDRMPSHLYRSGSTQYTGYHRFSTLRKMLVLFKTIARRIVLTQHVVPFERVLIEDLIISPQLCHTPTAASITGIPDDEPTEDTLYSRVADDVAFSNEEETAYCEATRAVYMDDTAEETAEDMYESIGDTVLLASDDNIDDEAHWTATAKTDAPKQANYRQLRSTYAVDRKKSCFFAFQCVDPPAPKSAYCQGHLDLVTAYGKKYPEHWRRLQQEMPNILFEHSTLCQLAPRF